MYFSIVCFDDGEIRNKFDNPMVLSGDIGAQWTPHLSELVSPGSPQIKYLYQEQTTTALGPNFTDNHERLTF